MSITTTVGHRLTGKLTIAEQCIDRQVKAEVFEGRQIDVSTGRVLLHALDADGRALCGHDRDLLAATGLAWSAGYLPHLPRCAGCRTAAPAGAGAARQTGHDPPSGQASGVDIRTAHGTDTENAAASALRTVLAGHDLRRWMFTDLVLIDETIRGGFSHPLTISPPRLIQHPALALTTFLHEELHWLEGPGTDSAIAEASERWPDPPPPPAGCRTAQSTWLHMSVCALEYQSLSFCHRRAEATTEARARTQVIVPGVADPPSQACPSELSRPTASPVSPGSPVLTSKPSSLCR